MVGDGEQREVIPLLSNILFADAFIQEGKDHFTKAQIELKRGDAEQAKVHYLRAGDALTKAFYTQVSPRLTDEENQERLGLIAKRFPLDEQGRTGRVIVSEEDWDRLQYLDMKASGRS